MSIGKINESLFFNDRAIFNGNMKAPKNDNSQFYFHNTFHSTSDTSDVDERCVNILWMLYNSSFE